MKTVELHTVLVYLNSHAMALEYKGNKHVDCMQLLEKISTYAASCRNVVEIWLLQVA